MANPVDAFLMKASLEVAKRELGYDQQMIEEDPEKADEVNAVGKRFLDDIDDTVDTITAALIKKYELKGASDKMVTAILQAVAQEAYLGNVSLNSIEKNDYIQSVGEEAAKEQKRVEVVQEIMDKCADAAFAYTVTSAVTISAVESIVPEKVALEAVKTAVMTMNPSNFREARKLMVEYGKSSERFERQRLASIRFNKLIGEKDIDYKRLQKSNDPESQQLKREIENMDSEVKREIREAYARMETEDKAINKNIFDQGKFIYRDYQIYGLNERTREEYVEKVISTINNNMPYSVNDSEEYTKSVQEKLLAARDFLLKADDFGKALEELLATFGPRDVAHNKAALYNFVNRGKTNLEKTSTETQLYAQVNERSANKEEKDEMFKAACSILNHDCIPKNLDTASLAKIITRCDERILAPIKEKLEASLKKGNPKESEKARDLLLRYDILRAAHVGVVSNIDKDKMVALMLSSSVQLLGQGVPDGMVKEALKSALRDSGFVEPKDCIKFFDELKDAKDKKGVEEAIGHYMEALHLEDIQPGDGNRFVEISLGGEETSNSLIQDNIKYTEMCSRVQNKELLQRSVQFMELLDNFDWINERHSNLEHLLLELREQEPELHEYMLGRLEEVNITSKAERTNDRVDKYAKLKGLYHETEDGRMEIDGEEYNKLYEKLAKTTKGTYEDLIAREREEAQKLREEREQEKEETVPVVEEHIEENHEEHAETTPENQSKTERDDDDYTM